MLKYGHMANFSFLGHHLTTIPGWGGWGVKFDQVIIKPFSHAKAWLDWAWQ